MKRDEGSLCDQSYDIANGALEQALKQCIRTNHSPSGSKEPNSGGKENANSNVLDPKVSSTKRAPKRSLELKKSNKRS
ncbi:hypothetical protein ACFX1Q_043982 [Malus domestica]